MSGVETKDLAYYQSNPNAIGDLSEEQLEALAATEGDTGEQPESGNAPDAAGSATKAESDVSTAGKQPAKTGEEAAPQGVATKDGKHVIPFEVLERERNRAAELERIAQEQAEQIAALMKQAKGGEAAPTPADGDAVILTEEMLSELDKDVPELARLFRAQQAQLKVLGDTVQNLSAERQAREDQSARTTQQAVQSAIDANLKLAYLQAQDPATWERAVRFDTTLRSDPEWAAKSFADRFAKVVELYEATYGAVTFPGQEPAPQVSQADLAKAAEEKLAGRKPAVPTSLSDIPGGVTPAADDVLGALATKSGPELTADFMRMTPAQIEATLARL